MLNCQFCHFFKSPPYEENLTNFAYFAFNLRWTDTGSRIMAGILFLITYQNIQKWFKTYQICAVNNILSHFGQISARGDKIFENSN